MDKKRIFFMGGYRGVKNLGDHAMALNMLERLTESLSDVEFYVLVNNGYAPLMLGKVIYLYTIWGRKGKMVRILNYLKLKKLYEIVILIQGLYILFCACIYRVAKHFLPLQKNAKKIIKALSQSDLILFGGGGHINDYATLTGVHTITLLLFLAKIFKKEVVMTGQGIGPLNSRFNRYILSLALPIAKFIATRDFKNSKILLEKMGVPTGKILAIGDDAVSLRKIKSLEVEQIFKEEKVDRHYPTFGFQFRMTNYERPYTDKEQAMYAHILDDVCRKFNAQLIFVPTNYTYPWDDRNAAFEIFKNMKCTDKVKFFLREYSPKQIKGIIGELDFFLGVSYHPLVFALSEGVPSLGFYNCEYYRLKLSGLFKWFNMNEFSIDITQTGTGMIMSRIEKVFYDRARISEQLANESEKMSQRLSGVIREIANTLKD